MKIEIKKETLLKAGKWSGYSLFFLVTFIFFFLATFPIEKVKGIIEKKAEQRGILLEIGNLSMKGITSIEGSNLKIGLKNPSQKERSVPIEKLKVSLSLLKYLIKKKIDISFEGNLADGEISDGKLKETSDGFLLEIKKIKEINLKKGEILSQIIGFELRGILNGGINCTLNKKGIYDSNGRIELNISKAMVSQPEIKTKKFGNFKLTDLFLNSMKFAIILDKISNIKDLRGGRRAGEEVVIYFQEGEIEGNEVRFKIAPHSVIKLLPNQPFLNSLLNLEFAFSLSEDFFNKEEKGGETPNKFLKTILSNEPSWKNAEVGGYYGVVCTGTLRNPNCVPKKPIVSGRGFSERSIPQAVKLIEEKKEKVIEKKKEEEEPPAKKGKEEMKIKMVPLEEEGEEEEPQEEEKEEGGVSPKIHGEINLQRLKAIQHQPYEPKIYSLPFIKGKDEILPRLIVPPKVENRENPETPQVDETR